MSRPWDLCRFGSSGFFIANSELSFFPWILCDTYSYPSPPPTRPCRHANKSQINFSSHSLKYFHEKIMLYCFGTSFKLRWLDKCNQASSFVFEYLYWFVTPGQYKNKKCTFWAVSKLLAGDFKRGQNLSILMLKQHYILKEYWIMSMVIQSL